MKLLRNFSIRRLLFVSFALISAVPVILLAYWVQHSAYNEEIEAVSERHLIIAKNLTGALSRYATDVRSGFRMAAFFSEQGGKPEQIYSLLSELHFKHIWKLNEDGSTEIFLTVPDHDHHSEPLFPTRQIIEPLLQQAAADPHRSLFSRVFITHTGESVICIVKSLERDGYLVGQLGTEYFRKVQQNVTFGERGHAAVVDQFGNTIAHPSNEWQSTARDITFLPPVAKMVAGETGVTQFYTPAMQADMIAGFTTVEGTGWGVMIPQPLSELRERANHLRLEILLFAFAAIFLFGGVLGLILARKLSRPIELLNSDMGRIRNFDLDGDSPVDSGIDEIRVMADALESMKKGLRAFRRFVPADIVRQLIATGQEAVPGGKEREITLFFSDVADFTSLSEQIPARDLMIELSDYLEVMTEQITAESGTIDKFIGDGIMAFWGAPLENEEHALHACRAALACQRAMQEFNASRIAAGKLVMPTRIGLHTGFTIVGNTGTSERLNYSAIGDNVNLASRLEGANKIYGSQIIISQATYRYVRNHFSLRPLDLVAVKGKRNSVMIYELLGDSESENQNELHALVEKSVEAFELYLNREWQRASAIYSELHTLYPDDIPSTILLKRCEKLLALDPGPEWSGTVRLRGDDVGAGSGT